MSTDPDARPEEPPVVTAGEERWRGQVLDYVDGHAEQIVASLSDLIRTPSISGSDEENGIQAVLAGQLGAIGLDVDHWQIPLTETLATPGFPGVEVDRREAWGLVAALPGSAGGPSLMLNAHVDVVPPGELEAWGDVDPFSGAADARDVHGRGACDMKGGLVAAAWAIRALSDLQVPLRGDLSLGCVQGEEDGGLGTFAMLQRGWHADACVIPEPTSLDVSPGNSGSLTFRLTVRGLAAHASRRRAGVSAVEKFWPVFTALRRLETERNAIKHPLLSRFDIPLAIEIGTVQSGSWVSTVPDLLTAEGRYGVGLGEDLEEARAALEEAVAEACADDPWLREQPVALEWWGGQFASGLTDPDHQIVGTVRRAHEAVSRAPQQMWATPYGSDLRLMTNLGRVPTVHYGPGDASVAHGPRESVPIQEVLTATRALALVAMSHCGVG